MQYLWFTWSLLLLVIWVIVYFSLNDDYSKKKMLVVSAWTSLLGLTEPIFVPEYWSPPSLFNLAIKTGFDIESLLFAFAIGGLAVVAYDKIYKVKHTGICVKSKRNPRHRFHYPILTSAPIIFIILYLFTNLNPIYSTFIALIIGGILTWYCRPDLKKKMLTSAVIFTIFYFVYIFSLISLNPNYVETVWNMQAISGILIFGVPVEELMFAFGLGFYWSSVYEHISWNKAIVKNKNRA